MRVIDLSRLLPGPYCTRILADLGFEVIRVEPPGGGDWTRYVPPLDPESGEGLLYRALNHGKKSLTLNLKRDEGRAIFVRLVGTADVLLDSFRPGLMARLGLGHETLAQANPRLIYCALSGYGPIGPYRDRAGHDLNYLALSGLLDLTGPRQGPPAIPGTQIADLSGALWAVVSILAALLEREQTGLGQRVDTSLFGGALSTLFLPITQYLGGQPVARGANELTGGLVCYNLYMAGDGGYVTLAALEPEFWTAFCRAVGREDLAGQQFAPAVAGEPAYDQLCDLFRSRTRQEWAEALAGVDACCEPVHTLAEALASAPVQALGLLTRDGLLPPVRFANRPLGTTGPVPALGQHTAELLAELGYSPADLARLQEEAVI